MIGDVKAGRGKAPVSAHPLFPAIVALWFAALFGLGSLAIRPGLLESAVLASHVDALIPSAAPPLGMTARILLACALAVGGGFLGAWIARNFAQPGKKRRFQLRNPFAGLQAFKLRARDAHPDAPVRRPLSAVLDFGSKSFDDPAPAARRRSLAMEEDYSPRDLQEPAPLPGAAVHILDLAAIGFTDEPIDAQPEHEEQVSKAAADDKVNAAMEHAVPQNPIAMELPSGSAADRITSAPVDTLGPVELVERLALALARKRAAAEAADVAAALVVCAQVSPPVHEPVLPPPLLAPRAMQPISLDDNCPDAAAQLQQSLDMPVTEADPQPDTESADAEMAADEGYVAKAGEDVEDTEAVLDEGYSSLLNISLPQTQEPRQEFVRVEQCSPEVCDIEPVVIFPGQSAEPPRRFDVPAQAATASPSAAVSSQNAEETERALRAALASIQRISGAA